MNERVIGNGSFGVVYQAQVKQTSKVTAAACQLHAARQRERRGMAHLRA